jgi:hypothetical protein
MMRRKFGLTQTELEEATDGRSMSPKALALSAKTPILLEETIATSATLPAMLFSPGGRLRVGRRLSARAARLPDRAPALLSRISF